MNSADTIFALSSGSVPSGVAVIRLSGPHVGASLLSLVGDIPEPRMAVLRTIRSRNNEMLDRGLVLYFPGPQSFTGEDCGELQIHGGRAVISAVLTELADVAGLRAAEPGEFTRRAFENGKLDLTAVEGLGDLIAAQTEAQRRLAIQMAAGGLDRKYGDWAKTLTRARALIEAEFDFSDEDDVPGSVADSIWVDLAPLAHELSEHLNGIKIGERIRDGFRIAIAGRPNVGKSSLLNALARRDVAIVSPEAGTTRDIVSVELDLSGYAVTLIDTAGIRETGHAVEKEGIRRARIALESADLALMLIDGEGDTVGLDGAKPERTIVVRTKCDLRVAESADADLAVSSVTGEGISNLINAIERELRDLIPYDGALVANRQRHRTLLLTCLNHMTRAIEAFDLPLELRAEELRAASDALGRLTGRVDAESLLDVIFSEFCIGK